MCVSVCILGYVHVVQPGDWWGHSCSGSFRMPSQSERLFLFPCVRTQISVVSVEMVDPHDFWNHVRDAWHRPVDIAYSLSLRPPPQEMSSFAIKPWLCIVLTVSWSALSVFFLLPQRLFCVLSRCRTFLLQTLSVLLYFPLVLFFSKACSLAGPCQFFFKRRILFSSR